MLREMNEFASWEHIRLDFAFAPSRGGICLAEDYRPWDQLLDLAIVVCHVDTGDCSVHGVARLIGEEESEVSQES